MSKSKKKTDKEPTTLSAKQVKEITDFIKGLKDKKVEGPEIRKQVFKKFGIDTTQWELNWADAVKSVKGSMKNTPVAAGSQLATTHNIVKRREPVNFQYHFNVDEINDRAKQQAQLELDRLALEDSKKNVNNDFKAKIEEKETQIEKLAREINSGFEMRNETCDVVRDFEINKKTVLYKGKVVKEEKLTNADYTLMFPDDQVEEELPY